jgi:copper chaperone CopZ
MNTVTYSVPNINCHHCVNTISSEIREIAGVKTVQGSVDEKKVTIQFESPATEETLKKALSEINYPVQG